MKRKPSADVYDFDEGDVEPFSAKRAKSFEKKKLFQSIFIGGRKNESNKHKNTTERLKKNMFSGDIFTKEANANQSLSVSDAIETDESDSESIQRRRDLDVRFGGAIGVSTRVFRDEEPVAEECKKVGIQGEELWFSDQKYSSLELKFTAAAIELKVQAFGAVRLPLFMLQNFSSGSHEEGPFFIRLDLTEDGAKFLQQCLGYSDSCTLCSTIYCTFLDNNFLAEKIKQITSLSDGYKRKWKPGIDHMRHHKEKIVNIIHRDRVGFNDGGSDHSFGDCNLYRSRESLSDWSDLIYPTEDDRDAVTVTKYDYLLLDPDQFLSDTIIDFYIKYLQNEIPAADKERFYFYNSFFFRKLTEVDKNLHSGLERSKLSFERVKRWTAGINIFDKDYLFIPIMQSAHWSLVIICYPGYPSAGCSEEGDFKAPMILHLDSLEGSHTSIEEPIRSYLVEAWREKKSHNEVADGLLCGKFIALKVPQQTNYSDCGLFLLHYVEVFVREVLERNSIDVTGMAFHNWFNPEDASRKRGHIQSLIQGLKAKKSVGEHARPHYFTDTCGVRPSEMAQRAVSLGHGVGESSACTRLGHDNGEFGYLEVVGEQNQFWHRCQDFSFDEREQGTAVNYSRPVLVPFGTHGEDNCVVQRYSDHETLEDSLECGMSDAFLEDIHSPEKETNNRPDESSAKEAVNASVKPGAVEERRVHSAGIFSLDDSSSEQVLQTCSASSGSSAEKTGEQLNESNAAIDGAKAVVHELQDDSPVELFILLEGKEAVKIDTKDVINQQTAVDSCEVIGMEGSSKLYPSSEVTAPIRSLEASTSQNEDCTWVPTFKEGGTCTSRLSLTVKESRGLNEAELDAKISNNRETMPKIVEDFGDGKRKRVSRRTKKQCKVGSVVRRLTRSATSGKL